MIIKNRCHLWLRMGLVLLVTTFLLLSIGCNLVAERTSDPAQADPPSVAAELPDEVKTVRDSALTYIGQQYNITLPMSDADWQVEYDILVDFTGTGVYRLTAADCVVTISDPLMGLDSSIYHVVLDDPAAGLHWEGDVDCQGQVLPSWSSTDEVLSGVPATINLVEAAGLRKTVGIEVCSLDCATYTPRYTIASRELISAIIAALDTDLLLRPRVPCPARYQLRFILSDGQHYNFGYACQLMTPTYLRGSQDFFMGKDAIAPDALNQLMLPLIAPGELGVGNQA